MSGGKQELDGILTAAGAEKLVVVDFSAAWYADGQSEGLAPSRGRPLDPSLPPCLTCNRPLILYLPGIETMELPPIDPFPSALSARPRCGPCRAIAPFLEQLAVEHADTCVFAAVDCEASPSNKALAAESGIRYVPEP